MSREIWKFPFEVEDTIQIDMPYGAIVRAVQQQGGKACIWAEVDTKKGVEPRIFYVLGTGHPIPQHPDYGHAYVGTWQAGQFVWHLYEVTGP